MTINLDKANIKDLGFIEHLLKENNLPFEDIKTLGKDFFLAYEGSLLVGMIGLEKFNNIGLLRSFVVKEEYRNKGYGRKICDSLIQLAKLQNIRELYLLTTTAKKFFEIIGFKVIEKTIVPFDIKNTAEFQGLCPATAVCLKINF